MTDAEKAAKVMEGCVHGMEHATFQAWRLELEGAREARVLEAAYAPTDREMNQGLGAVKALDDLKAKMEENVAEALRRMREAQEKG